MGNIRYLFKKVRDTKGIIFHAKMGAVRERNDMNLTEAGDTKNRCVKNTQTCTKIKKISMTQINHNGVITYLEQDMLECEAKWALGSITCSKASGGDRIPVDLIQILKDDAV